MGTIENVVCLDLDFNIDVEAIHRHNMLIISENLSDFNERFGTDFIILYSTGDFLFSPIDDEKNELLLWFLQGTNELLGFAYSPTMSSFEDLNMYLYRRRYELIILFNVEMYDRYRTRYINYAPLGFLTKADHLYIKEKLTDMILDHSMN
ncbi:MAG: hypothetical protein RSH24_19160 [Flavobacterium sp.]